MTGVLLVSPSGVPGGAERALVGLARHLPSFGFQPAAVVLQEGVVEEWFAEVGCPVSRIEAGRMRQLPAALRTVNQLRRLIGRQGSGAVVSNMAKGHIYGGLAAHAAGVPGFWWQHGIPDGGLFESLAARVPAAGVVCSCEDAMAAQRRLTPRRPCFKVYPGSAVAEMSSGRGSGAPIRAELGWQGRPIVGIVGRLQPWKGQGVFLQAAAQVAAVRPEVRFLIVGGAILGWEDDYPEELRRLSQDLGIEDRVHFAGHQPDIYPWFDALDVVVNASFGEPFGLVLVEAMALGKPLVATAAGGPLEIVEDGVSGLLVPVGEPDPMAQAILRVLTAPVLAASLGREAELRARQFSEERMAEGFAEVLRAAVGPKTGAPSPTAPAGPAGDGGDRPGPDLAAGGGR